MSDKKILVGDMSRETAIGILKLMLEAMEVYDSIASTSQRRNAVQMAIASLETDEAYQLEYESTTKNDLGVDAISRAYLYNRIKGIDHDEDYECDEYGGSRITYHTCDWDEVLREIEDAPSVTPQEPKIGEWIKQNDDYYDWYECSECGYGSEGEMQYSSECDVRTNYCPNCGAMMVEPQESEVEDGKIDCN